MSIQREQSKAIIKYRQEVCHHLAFRFAAKEPLKEMRLQEQNTKRMMKELEAIR